MCMQQYSKEAMLDISQFYNASSPSYSLHKTLHKSEPEGDFISELK